MTGQAERIREQHRGSRMAAPASQSRLAALNTFGLSYSRIDDFNVLVEGRYQLNLAMSYWRAVDGSSHGYLVSALYAEINKINSEKPVTGRDNVPAELEATELHQQHVESVTGPISFDELVAASASLLPLVTP